MSADAARRRLRLLFLQSAVALSDVLCDRIRKWRGAIEPVYPLSIGNGVSIIVPERGNGTMLSECLSAALSAARRLPHPFEVIVVVDGGGEDDYRNLATEFQPVRWIFNRDPVGFSGAVRKGLDAARHDWVYLLNNDMILEEAALSEAMSWRAPHIFAVGSQIFFKDPARRREETGWTRFRIRQGCIETYDDLPEDPVTVRGAAYASGGSSLFQKRLLREILGSEDPYYPFYWEDFEWSAVAWKMGYETRFCPASKAWHYHRGTISRYYSPAEVGRIFVRNALQFQMRNMRHLGSFEQVCARIMELDPVSFWDLVGKKNVRRVFQARIRSARYPFDDTCLQYVCARYYLKRPLEHSKPAVLFVSPFAICPPSHGGAMRMHRLLQRLSEDFDLIVLSDEHEAYSEASRRYFEGLHSVHLVGGRSELPEDMHTRIGRINSHCHPALRNELKRRIACDRPDLVQIEFMELAGLIETSRKAVPWAITLHEVTLSDHAPGPSEEDIRETSLIDRYDAAITCSAEDTNLLENTSKATIGPNGMDLDGFEYESSEKNSAILFLGPFRYKPNLEGVQLFLEKVYPGLREMMPRLELWALGGHGAVDKAAGLDCFKKAGVTVYDFIPDPRPFLYRCAVTINPLIGSRGSSLKLIESIAAGRVCVSTVDGARGFVEAGFPSLFTKDRVEDFFEPLERLLRDPFWRVSIEKPDRRRLEQYSWADSARKQSAVYQRLLAGRS